MSTMCAAFQRRRGVWRYGWQAVRLHRQLDCTTVCADVCVAFANMESKRITNGVSMDRDVAVTLRDGVHLMANVFRPFVPGPAPVLMSVTPYGKDALPDRVGTLLMRLSGVRFGKLDCSKWTGFEAPDPLFWTQAGYAVMQADTRGMHKSEGQAGVLSDRDAEYYYELIEWAARQPWSTGPVRLLAVSYLPITQCRRAPIMS